VEHKLGHTFALFVPTEFQFQVVAGVKYKVQVTVNENKLTQIVWAIIVELFENTHGVFSFIDAYPLYFTGTKIKSHLYQTAGVAPISAKTQSDLLKYQGPGPVKPPHLPLGPGPVVPPIKIWQPADKHVIEIAEKQKAGIEALLGAKFSVFLPIEYATYVQLTTTTYYIIIETGEFKYVILGEPHVIKKYIEATIVFSILTHQYTLADATYLDGIPPIIPPTTPTSTGAGVGAGSGGGLQGPYVISPELAEVVVAFKKLVEEATSIKYVLFRPVSYYYQVVAGSKYYVQTLVQNADGSQVVYPIYVVLFLGLVPDAHYEFVSVEHTIITE